MTETLKSKIFYSKLYLMHNRDIAYMKHLETIVHNFVKYLWEKSRIQKSPLLHAKWWGNVIKLLMGTIRQILGFYHLYDIPNNPNIHIKFDNNRSGSFRNYLFNKNRHRRHTDKPTEGNGRPLFVLYASWNIEKHESSRSSICSRKIRKGLIIQL